MKLKIVTPERIVYDDDVDAVYAKAIDGELGILPKHVPLVTPLDIAVMHFKKADTTYYATVMEGLLSTDGETVTILTEAAEMAGDIDFARAEAAWKRAEAKLKSTQEKHEADRAQADLERAVVRMKLK